MESKEIIKKRASIKSKLTQFIAYLKTARTCEQLSSSQLIELELRIDKLENSYASYDEFQSELELLADKPDELYAEREQFESAYYTALAEAKALSIQHRDGHEPGNDGSEVGSGAHTVVGRKQKNVRLPIVNIPHFGGGYKSWLEFKDIYISLIHEDKSIDDITKFHYLRTSLYGSAAVVVQSLDFKSENYHTAWSLLCDRYDNNQLLVNNHVQALFSVEPVLKDSSQSLRTIVDETKKHLRALETLKQPVQHWDTLIIHIMSSKLDPVTNIKWEEKRNSLSEAPTLDFFIKFISDRSNLLESLEESKSVKSKQEINQNKSKSLLIASTPRVDSTKHSCPMCKKQHYVFSCETFRALPVEQRIRKVKEFKVCLNCLRPGHVESKCRLGHCKYCTSKHNTLLHKHDDPPSRAENVTLSACNKSSYSSTQHVLLSTALVTAYDGNGKPHSARVLLDNGSTTNFITQDLCRKLNLPTRSVTSKVSGINNQVSDIARSCSLHIGSFDGSYQTDIDCLVMPKITSNIPNTYINTIDIPIPSGISLADPSYNVPSSIDILVGADIFWSVIGTTRIQLGKQYPHLFETKLGWLISGVLHQPNSTQPLCMLVQSPDLTRFWELDTILSTHDYTEEERLCEQSFINTTKRNQDGKFIVSMPLKDSPEVLGDSFVMAKRRFLTLERKLEREPNFKKLYVEFMEEYEALGHMSEIPYSTSSDRSYYLPHHGVMRESSTTTKLRVVFDASAVTTSGKSLNNIQFVGPRVQDDLLAILLRFREHKIVISGDIEKMYRMVELDSTQHALQRVLWRSNPSQKLKTYILKTVTYGTASGPFLSTRCLLELSKNSTDSTTQRAIAHDFYVDDFLSGTDSVQDTIALTRSVIDTLSSAQFNLRKLQSNSSEVLQSLSNNSTSSNSLNLSENELSKTLGLNWQCNTDTLTFSINLSINTDVPITKRHILSTIAQVFDPLGLVSPCIVEAKILMQRLWLDKCSWDDEVGHDIKTSWLQFAHTLPYLNQTNIPRWVLCTNPSSIQLHIFTDASEKAYGACVYVRSIAQDGSIEVRLLVSKSKVAPIKPTTIPRLELCGALVGTRLCTKVLSSLTLKPECVFWCDSMIVIGWLSSSPAPLKPFVRHRVCEIQEGFRDHSWRYVPSKENPADLVSRGLSANLISDSTLWWSGPAFLSSDSSCWPDSPNKIKLSDLPDITTKHTALVTQELEHTFIHNMIQNSSSFSKLQRILAHIYRFINNCRNNHSKQLGCLTLPELDSASNSLLYTAQQESFPDEYRLLKLGESLPKNNRLISLSPFLENNLIRVGGRLDNSYYDYNVKHPILLCSKHHLTKLIFKMFHLRLYHAGPQLLLANIRHNYWALGGRNLAKNTVRTCIKCIRFKAQTIQPVMGNLPKERLHLEFPFLETGTDYAGPILIADRKGRGCRLIKSYICVFVCLATRAVHLELVSDLTKEAFIAALNRFTARRGKPKTIFSDNGTTFVGSFNELSNILKQDIAQEMAESGINFSFIPCYTPYFGGLWESAVKSIKHLLKRTLSLTHLTYEEMSTSLIMIESILNSRPITPLSNDPFDLVPLSPFHFLIGRSQTFLPHPDITDAKITNLQRFQRVEFLKQHFWNRFSNEYVSSLQQRLKWQRGNETLEEGMMVIVKEKNQPPLMWLLGRIVRVIPGKDNIARVADVRTRKGIIRRAYNMLCPLPISS